MREGSPVSADPADGAPEPGLHLAQQFLHYIDQYVLAKSRSQALRPVLTDVEQLLQPGLTLADVARIDGSVAGVLSEYQQTLQKSTLTDMVEMQHIVGMLNQALMVLAGGSERSLSRLRSIQESLEKTSKLQDIGALRSRLAETVSFIEQESVREHQTSTKDIEDFQHQVAKARESVNLNRTGLAGRADGIVAITESVKSITVDTAVYLAAFVFDRLPGIVQRYGVEAAEELMLKLLKDRVQPVASACSAFRWSSSSLLAVFSGKRDLTAIRKEIGALNHAPMMHRVMVGHRTAVLNVNPSHLVLEVTSAELDPVIEELDRFTGFRAPFA